MKNFIFIVIILFAFTSCHKKDEVRTVPGGVVRCLLSVQHHTVPIPYARIFVKRGTLVFPGTDTTLYDLRYVTDANGNYTMSGILNGQQQYVFYAKGVDPGWDSTHVTPVWGYQYLITDTHNLESKDYPLTIPVSE
ncbi:MAG: hypothetical protein HY064_04550 [Bacteroidetes bacterium]|nr:hypothetical protein [Bacteroidota bacterium]